MTKTADTQKTTNRLPKLTDDQLVSKSNYIRKELVEVSVKNKAGHIAPSLSCVDILVSLYYSIMNLSQDPKWEERDRLVFSKAHGCYGLYAILADVGYVNKQEWQSFYNGSPLSGCAERDLDRGIEIGCGSLGHGLPMAVGIAFGAKLQKKDYRTYCVVGDGEMQEGSNWEAVQFAVKFNLSNLTIIIDSNKLQAMDFLENVLTPKGKTDDLQNKLEAFGCNTKTCNGHNAAEIVTNINNLLKQDISAPQALIANTIKGYGLVCMENIPKFHFRIPTKKELDMGSRYD